MAKMFTRTITTTEVEVLCLNTETAEPCNIHITLSGEYKDAVAIKKAIEKGINKGEIVVPEEISICKVAHFVVSSDLYGSTEQEFIAIAKKLPPRKTNK